MLSAPDANDVASTLLEHLEKAWNAGDGAAFAEPFTPDADFVNVRGELFHGPEIGPGHERLFSTVYAGSAIAYRLVQARQVVDAVVLAHFRASLEVPTGPAAGAQEALGSLVIVATPEGWHVRAFHNTYVA
jgi:uncharacterized protein (TIGR02246 family)